MIIYPPQIRNNEAVVTNQKWWSPRLGHDAVLAASKPLQVSKYPRGAILVDHNQLFIAATKS